METQHHNIMDYKALPFLMDCYTIMRTVLFIFQVSLFNKPLPVNANSKIMRNLPQSSQNKGNNNLYQ